MINRTDFEEKGFLLIENFVSAEKCDELISRTKELVQEFKKERSITSVFSTQTQAHLKTNYFLESADKISYFFEESAFNEEVKLLYPIEDALNKIGHALHDLDPVFSQFSRQEKIKNLIESLGYTNPLLVQSMYIFKQPYIGGAVEYHQDATYLYSSPKPPVGLWFALEDATIENGCLWAIPGGHHQPLREKFYRSDNNILVKDTLDETPWFEELGVPLEVSKGSVIALHGHLPHASKPNLSEKSRHAYTLHLVDKSSHYAENNWLQRSKDFPFQGFS